jgi:hypothetical protein
MIRIDDSAFPWLSQCKETNIYAHYEVSTYQDKPLLTNYLEVDLALTNIM